MSTTESMERAAARLPGEPDGIEASRSIEDLPGRVVRAPVRPVPPSLFEGSLLLVGVGPRLDMAEVRRIRHLIRELTPLRRVDLDFGGTRGADADAVLLLEGELSRLEARATKIRLCRVSERLHLQFHLHPVVRFLDRDDDLFTDPDLDWPGFRPSRH